MYTIELDCAPGAPRPDMLLPQILKGTGITTDSATCVSKFFGNWTFQISENVQDLYKSNLPLIADRIKELYQKGRIRYGSW